MEVLDFSFPPAPRRLCRVRVGSGALDSLVADLEREAPGSPLLLVTDSNVAPLYARPLAARLERGGFRVGLFEFPAGEAAKTRETKAGIEDALLRAGAGRDAAVVAVGGGVTGDLAGFAAATWHRGIPVVQVPTSLLSMVDAALGGKTAVNVGGAKNLVGSFHQPWGVYADPALLSTLPEDELRQGLAEAVKSAVVGDAGLFRWLESAVARLLARDEAALERTVLACMRLKSRVVRRDEREGGRRAALNFGHTVGHALEKVVGPGLRHGSAVAVGRIEALLDACGLPTRLPSGCGVDDVIAATTLDKKVRAGRVRYALPRRIGRMPAPPELARAVEERVVREALNATR